MSDALSPDYEAEIRDRLDRLDDDRVLTGSTWQASSVGGKTVLPPDPTNAVEDVLETEHAVIRGSVGIFASKLYAEFTAHARDDMPALLAEVDRLRAQLADVAYRARRVAISHEHFIQDHSDPGTEALAAQYELMNWLSASAHHADLPLNPVENALRVVLAHLDEWDENTTPREIRGAIAEALPRDDMSDKRFRIYIDGKGNGWIEVSVEDDGTQYLADVRGPMITEVTADKVKEDSGSLREIGRCW